MVLDFSYIIIILIIGLILSYKTAKIINNNIVFVVFIEHLLFSYFYYLFSLTGPADSNGYYYRALYNEHFLTSFNIGTDFIDFIATIPVRFLHFSLLSSHLLFGLLGFIGFTYLLRIIKNTGISFFGIPATILIVLLPGFHFWTSALGKDSLFFMALMMFFFSLINIRNNKLRILFSFFIIGMIRPHMAMIILMSISVILILRSPKNFSVIHFLSIFAIGVLFIISLPIVLEFVGIDELSTESIESQIEIYNAEGKRDNAISSNIDVSNYNLPQKMFAYLFRPLFFDAKSSFQLMASIENLFLLILFLRYFFKLPKRKYRWYKQLPDAYKIMFIYITISWFVLSINMYNLGLASRQKFMLIPIIFILFSSEQFFIKRKNTIK